MCQKRHVYFMAKEEIFKNRLATWFFAKQLGAFPVKRGAGDTGALDTARRIVEEGKLLGIFPEGTRSKDGRLGRAKSGAALIAAQTGASVLPSRSPPKTRSSAFSVPPGSCLALLYLRRSCTWTIPNIRICVSRPAWLWTGSGT